MNPTNPKSPRGEYGFDAPYVPLAFVLGATVFLAMGVSGLLRHNEGRIVAGFITGLWFAASAASYLYTTRVGKHRVWSDLLDGLKLRGNERVVDVGCGRGAVLCAVASRLPEGFVSGIDIWSAADEAGSAVKTTRSNAESEGVADRVTLCTGDMRALPYPSSSVDLVLSSLAMHNVANSAGRDMALEEMMRVLKPGGRILLADIRFTEEYAERLRANGALEVERRPLGWRFWYGGPHAATWLVSARKRAPATR